MGEATATLIAIGVVVPLVMFLIYLGFRNLTASVRNVRQAVDRAASSAPNPPLRESMSPASDNPAARLAVVLQEQAKKSDDAHKARIQAHASRQVPPISDDGRETIKRGLKARLAINHRFPPRLPQRSMSYFGGLPIVPEDFDWPTLHNRKGLLERLNFVAQIDCSDLPSGPGRDLFPDRGYLYFFAPMSGTFGSDAMHFVTRYEPRQATQKWTPLTCHSPARSTRTIRWTTSGGASGRITTRSRSSSAGYEEPSDDEVAARADEGHAFEVADKIRVERLEAFYGPPVAPDRTLSAQHAPKDALWIPYAGFPINWRSARIIRKCVEAYHREETQDVATG